VISHDHLKIIVLRQHKPEVRLGRASLRDASIVRLDRVSKIFLCEKTLAGQDGSPEGLYNSEGDA
jgi:hypothetical protein